MSSRRRSASAPGSTIPCANFPRMLIVIPARADGEGAGLGPVDAGEVLLVPPAVEQGEVAVLDQPAV